jgi:hypothetical protein
VRSDRKLNGDWIKKRNKKKDSHSANILQMEFKQVEKTRNAEQESLIKSKDTILLLVNVKLDYCLNDNIPIRTQGENDSSLFSNSEILVVLHQTVTVIQTFMRMFTVCCVKRMWVCLFS